MRVEISVEFHHESPTAFGLYLEKIIVPNIHSHYFQVIESPISSEYLAT